jgi:hypothetical protein
MTRGTNVDSDGIEDFRGRHALTRQTVGQLRARYVQVFGKPTRNVPLSFAQFEREIISERAAAAPQREMAGR